MNIIDGDMKDMTPIDAGAAVLIPQGNLNSDIPGTYGWYQKIMKNNGLHYSSKGYKEGYNSASKSLTNTPVQKLNIHDYGK